MSEVQSEISDGFNHKSNLYSTPQEFLEQVSLHVDTQSSIYQYVDSHLYPTSNPDDEYVVIVLEVKDPSLRNFYGGRYLIQQWTKKRKLFQTVHHAKPNRFFLYKQRYIYSMFGTSEESSWLYIVNFYQEIFNKIRHPAFNKDTKDATHELSLYVDAKLMLVGTFDKIMWAPFKFEENKESGSIANSVQPTPRPEEESKNLIPTDSQATFNDKNKGSTEDLEIKSQNLKPTLLDTTFKSVFGNIEGDLPEFLQILDINYEGFQQKEINIVCECETKIVVFKLQPVKLRKFTIFKMVEKYRFDKIQIGLQFRELVHTVRMVQIGEQENILLMTKGQGELILLTEKQIENTQTQQQKTIAKLSLQTQRHLHEDEPLDEPQQLLEAQQVEPEEEDEDDSFEKNKDASMRLKAFFIRRTNIYLEDMQGNIKCLNSGNCKIQRPLKRCTRIMESKEQVQLSELAMHLGFFSDYLIASTACVLAHGKILSIYDFKTSKWSHILPDQQGSAKKDEDTSLLQDDSRQSYFGQPDEEIQSLVVNNIFQNSIYDCLVLYKSKQLRRVKYFNEVQKTCFEKAVIFRGDKVRQIVKNYDMITYRQYGDSQARTYFMVQNLQTRKHEIWISENGSKMTKLVRNIEQHWIMLNLSNAPSDLLAIYEPTQRRLSIFSIHHTRQCLDPDELRQFLKISIDNWGVKGDDDPQAVSNMNYFYFNDKLFYLQDGNIIIWNMLKKNRPMKELNFKSAIKEFFMTQSDSVYYKDKNNVFRYANLKIQKKFDIQKLPTKVQDCQGAFVQKLDYCLMTNRFAFFTSPFKVTITPNLNNYSIDLMSTLNFESNFVFSKQIQNKLYAFKQPNIIVSWDLDTGKVVDNLEYDIFLKGFKKLTDWNGASLLKQVRDQAFDPDSNDEYPPGSKDYEDEKKARYQFPDRQLFSLVEIGVSGDVQEICRFLYDLKIGQQIYVSYPYALVMDNDCTKFFLLESKIPNSKFRTLKALNSFYEPQMKVGKPVYFSPNFLYRIYIDGDTKKVVINYTLTNSTIMEIDNRKQLMYQKSKNHPMIYFHDNDHIMYLTIQGIEKLMLLEKSQKRKKTIYSLKEVANCYHNEKEIVRRVLYDQFNFKKELGSQIKHVHMLQIRAGIIKRGLLLNEYTLGRVEEDKPNIKSEYPDKNIGDFSYFIVDSYRRELNFSYLAWKIIEQIKNKKLSIMNLRREFVTQLIFTILPHQQTILHYLNENFEELENFLKIINDVDPVAITTNNADIEINDIPFLPNLEGLTPLHISIEKNNTRFTDKIVSVLAETDFDHHTRFIMDQLHHLIEQVPQALGYYLENRKKCPNWLVNYTRGKLEPVDECEFKMVSNQMWYEELHVTLPQQMFDEEVIEQPLMISILDLPDMQKFENKNADKFLEVLSETDNIDLFKSSSVRAVVELKWPLTKKAMVKYLFYPYLALLFLFLYYSVFIFEELQLVKLEEAAAEKQKAELEVTNDDNSTVTSFYSQEYATYLRGNHHEDGSLHTDGDHEEPEKSWRDLDGRELKEFLMQNQKQIVKLLILGLCAYFFLLNFRQFVIQGPTKYFTGPWNYIDLIPLSLITCSMLLEYFLDFPTTERAINAVSVFFIWLKFLYFLRMYRSSSKFISMIVAVISDMKIFLAVFIISLVTFSQSMYIISNNQSEDEKFITSFFDSMLFTYRISLGDWDTSGLGTTDVLIIMTLFILSTLFLCVVMLNLLIAIISDTYARVDSTSQNELYKNLADLIIENEYLIPKASIQEHDNAGSYLYIAEIDTNEGALDKMDQRIDDLKKTMIFRTSIVDRCAHEFAKQMAFALEQSKEKFTTLYLEESVKNDLKFKMQLKKSEGKNRGGHGSGTGTPRLDRGMSEDISPEKMQRAVVQAKKNRRSARPNSRKSQGQQEEPTRRQPEQ